LEGGGRFCGDAITSSAGMESKAANYKAANYLSTKKKKDQLALAQYGDKLLCEQARS